MSIKLFANLFFVSLLSIILVSCSNNNNQSKANFTGPWADEFANLENENGGKLSAEYKNIISDSKITYTELQEGKNILKNCMKSLGFTVKLDDNGGMEIKPPEKNYDDNNLGKDTAKCNVYPFPLLASIYDEIRANPERKDHATVMANCLKKHKLVPNDYTANDWQHDFDSDDCGLLKKYLGDNATWKNMKKYEQCQNDPLGIISKENNKVKK